MFHLIVKMVQSDLAEGAKAGSFVAAPQGLFPAPLPPGRQGSRLLPRFTLLGRAAAKALQDGRMLDVPLSYTFYRCGGGHFVGFLPINFRKAKEHASAMGPYEQRSCKEIS
jgi:hypothetical protein